MYLALASVHHLGQGELDQCPAWGGAQQVSSWAGPPSPGPGSPAAHPTPDVPLPSSQIPVPRHPPTSWLDVPWGSFRCDLQGGWPQVPLARGKECPSSCRAAEEARRCGVSSGQVWVSALQVSSDQLRALNSTVVELQEGQQHLGQALQKHRDRLLALLQQPGCGRDCTDAQDRARALELGADFTQVQARAGDVLGL